ncbi:MAG: hypothetical protein JRE45_21095 [Deltaproteobacteria bacterium]|nr:hypothetical protein [Deltaproteobacteria bacterium]
MKYFISLCALALALMIAPSITTAGCNPEAKPTGGTSGTSGTSGTGGTSGTAGTPAGKLIGCANDALTDFNAYLDPLIEVLKAVENPAYQLPAGITLIWDAGAGGEEGEFTAVLDLTPERELFGTVRPQENCNNGMAKGDVCVFPWSVTLTESLDEVAYGTMSAIALGVSLPLNTTATRYTIVDREPKVVTGEDCSIVVTLFDMMFHLRIDEMYSLSMGFDIAYSDGGEPSTMSGSVIWGTSVGETATITFTWDGPMITCSFDLETFEVGSCS